MKVPVYGINYAPELSEIGKYTAPMAATLASRGRNVRVVYAAVGSCGPAGAAYRALREFQAVASPGDAIAHALAATSRAVYPATPAKLAGRLADRLDKWRTYTVAYSRLPSPPYVQTRRSQENRSSIGCTSTEPVKLKCFNTVSTISNNIPECAANKRLGTPWLLRFQNWGACSIDSIAFILSR
jgi:hypothetical protein